MPRGTEVLETRDLSDKCGWWAWTLIQPVYLLPGIRFWPSDDWRWNLTPPVIQLIVNSETEETIRIMQDPPLR